MAGAAFVPAATDGWGEQTLAARAGGWLFKRRGYVPIPLLLILLVAPAPTLGWGGLGGVLIVVGEVLRLAGVAVAGPETRRRTRLVRRLVTHGPFAWTRNPLYLGNFLAWTGFALFSERLWFVAVAMVWFTGVYSLIVRYEEAVLESLFGAHYLAYKRRTHRWLPWPPAPSTVGGGAYDWRDAWIAERSTFSHYVGLAILLVVKARWPVL